MVPWAEALPAFTWAFPVLALLYFRVWPVLFDRPPAKWPVVSPFVSIVVPMTLIVGVTYEYDLLVDVVVGLYAVALAVEIGMFAWVIDERRDDARPRTNGRKPA